ncbi:NAD(P)-binding protein [Ceratobasidium sp. AG-I]|nr:NAD(P)-binding protein [Ceratobasidium sp. AG-I]
MGIAYSLYYETFPGKPRWSVDQIPDLTGQTIIVTGGNAGIGRETCKALLNKGANVYIAARDKKKVDQAIEWLTKETGGKSAYFLELNLADLSSVRRAAEDFKRKEQELHVLFNNAGVMVSPVEQKTTNGYDLQFGTNVLGHYLFTTLLLPVLIHTAKVSPLTNGTARVINTSSSAHWIAPRGGIDYTTLTPNNPEAEEACRKLGSARLHGQSKWGVIAFSAELARRYGPQGIISTSLHPGAVRNTWHDSLTGIWAWLVNLTTRPTAWGALTQLYAGTSPEGVGFSGKYLIAWGRLSTPRPGTLDEGSGKKLWTWLEEQAKLH